MKARVRAEKAAHAKAPRSSLQAYRESERRRRSEERAQRRREIRCFWTWPFGHVWSPPDASDDQGSGRRSMRRHTERWSAKASTATSLRAAARRSSFCVSLAALLLPAVSCGHKPSDAQALRTCVDRWNQGNMVGWGPGPANVAFRSPNAKEKSSIGLSSSRQCIVATPAGDGTWTCVLSSTGAYWCPPLHEATGPRLPQNATLDRRGVLELDSPPKSTHPAPPLAWQRYPRVDGYVHPWTSSAKLRPGLRFKGAGRGRCFLAAETVRSAVSCLAGDSRSDACFPQRRPWQRGPAARAGRAVRAAQEALAPAARTGRSRGRSPNPTVWWRGLRHGSQRA